MAKPTVMAFPLDGTPQDMDHLVLSLNAAHLKGAWHFARGTRMDAPFAKVIFDNPEDALPMWRRYCEERSALNW